MPSFQLPEDDPPVSAAEGFIFHDVRHASGRTMPGSLKDTTFPYGPATSLLEIFESPPPTRRWILSLILDRHPAMPNEKDVHGWTPLMRSIEGQAHPAVQMLAE